MLFSRTVCSFSPAVVARACTKLSQPCASRRLTLSLHVAPRALFSTSPRRLAKEAPNPKPDVKEEAVEAFKQSAMYQKLATNVEALAALQKFGETMKKHGVDASNGPPSMFQMSKLLLNAEFREASKQLVETLQAAGVDLNSKDAMQEMQEVMKKMQKKD